jgi:ABC-type dipeptide/oligopeptide/nickel transport system permease subunit
MAELTADSPGPWVLAWRRLKKNRAALAALVFLALLFLAALLAPVLASHEYKYQYRGAERLPPSFSAVAVEEKTHTFYLGTDASARDVYSRMLFGARVSLLVGFIATAISLSVGVTLGMLSGYFGGWIDACIMRLTDTVFAFPSVLLAVAITAVFEKPSLAVVFMALGVVGWTGLARVVRSQTLSIKTLDYVQAARALGANPARILFLHILPNCAGPIVIVATLSVGGNILGEAGLSFLGLGVQEPYPSWGGMLAQARDYYRDAWWLGVFPGLAIVSTVLAFNLFGDGLRDALDPRHNR